MQTVKYPCGCSATSGQGQGPLPACCPTHNKATTIEDVIATLEKALATKWPTTTNGNPPLFLSRSDVEQAIALIRTLRDERDRAEGQCADHQRGENDALSALEKAEAELTTLREIVQTAEDLVIHQAKAHWFTQGGEAEFGALTDVPINADMLVAEILRLVRERVQQQDEQLRVASNFVRDILEAVGERGHDRSEQQYPAGAEVLLKELTLQVIGHIEDYKVRVQQQEYLIVNAATILRSAPVREGEPWVMQAVAWLRRDGVPGTTSSFMDHKPWKQILELTDQLAKAEADRDRLQQQMQQQEQEIASKVAHIEHVTDSAEKWEQRAKTLGAEADRLQQQMQDHRECHDLSCDGDRRQPRGASGSSCSCKGRDAAYIEVEALRQKVQQQEQEIGKALAYLKQEGPWPSAQDDTASEIERLAQLLRVEALVKGTMLELIEADRDRLQQENDKLRDQLATAEEEWDTFESLSASLTRENHDLIRDREALRQQIAQITKEVREIERLADRLASLGRPETKE